MKGCKAMVETKYEATPLKTFLCFVIYIVSNIVISSFITSFFQLIMFCLMYTEEYISNYAFFNFCTLLTHFFYIAPSFIIIPLVRKLLIKLSPSLTASATNALLYISLSYLLSVFISLLFIANLIMCAFYLALYFYYKFIKKSSGVTVGSNNNDMNIEQNHNDYTE